MLATKILPPEFAEWNYRHAAPYGRQVALRRWQKWFKSAEDIERRRGPFALQPNNSIRQFEYPWAFHAAGLKPGMKVLELGGSLSGFQFVIAASGCSVVNVDPGMESAGWPCNQDSMQKLNRRFGTNVVLKNTTIENAGLADGEFDRAVCISVIEHLPGSAAAMAMREIHRALKPGGRFVLTTDLFLNVRPFCSREENEYGRNQDLRVLIDPARWELVDGDRRCLYGFPEFNPDFIMSNLENYLIGIYPALAQCLVLKKI